jgi:hypothetical protein
VIYRDRRHHSRWWGGDEIVFIGGGREFVGCDVVHALIRASFKLKNAALLVGTLKFRSEIRFVLGQIRSS